VEAPDEARQLLELAVAEAQSGIDGLRDLTSTIHPAILTTRGLAPALDALIARLPCHVELRLAPERIPARIESCTYFVCSEALANVVAHAKVDRASVTTTSHAGRFTVEVSDNGVGGAAVRPRGGLEGIEDRVVAVGGSLHVTTPPAGGTTVTACFELDPDS
jgi:signal transduction histidine kinase